MSCFFCFFSAFKDGILKVCLDEQFTFPHVCDTLLSRKIENKTYVFGLTSHYRLFMNDKEVLTNFVVIIINSPGIYTPLLRIANYKTRIALLDSKLVVPIFLKVDKNGTD